MKQVFIFRVWYKDKLEGRKNSLERDFWIDLAIPMGAVVILMSGLVGAVVASENFKVDQLRRLLT